MAARANKPSVMMADFDEAIERSAVGLKRQSRIMQEDEKQRVAYHEAGHALVALRPCRTRTRSTKCRSSPRRWRPGLRAAQPDDDRYLMTQSELESHIRVSLAGTLAEELVFRENLQWGDQRLARGEPHCPQHGPRIWHEPHGARSFPHPEPVPFLAGAGDHDGDNSYSEETAREIDVEVRKIIDLATDEVLAILQARRAALEAVAQRLMEREVIDGEELREILAQCTPRRTSSPAPWPSRTACIQPPRPTSQPHWSVSPRPAKQSGNCRREEIIMPILEQTLLQPRHEIFHIDRILHPETNEVPTRKHKIIAVMPAYNAESTLAATLATSRRGHRRSDPGG